MYEYLERQRQLTEKDKQELSEMWSELILTNIAFLYAKRTNYKFY
jgi:hypothetical protein